MPRARPGPEQQARADIDVRLEEAGWVVQDREDAVITAALGVAVREFKLADGHGYADYMLFVDGKAVGVLEAKAAGHTLTSVELQASKYSTGLPPGLNPPVNPLPFLYVSTGVQTLFVNLLDPDPRSRQLSMTVPHIHRPQTLREWLAAEPRVQWPAEAAEAALRKPRPSTLRSRILTLPPLDPGGLRPNQIEGVERLEDSLKRNRPRALVQMATGSGKTIFAITSIYRLVKYAQARRVLFLVDRTNLGEQAEKEFQVLREGHPSWSRSRCGWFCWPPSTRPRPCGRAPGRVHCRAPTGWLPASRRGQTPRPGSPRRGARRAELARLPSSGSGPRWLRPRTIEPRPDRWPAPRRACLARDHPGRGRPSTSRPAEGGPRMGPFRTSPPGCPFVACGQEPEGERSQKGGIPALERRLPAGPPSRVRKRCQCRSGVAAREGSPKTQRRSARSVSVAAPRSTHLSNCSRRSRRAPVAR